jgi:hypothetical protein
MLHRQKKKLKPVTDDGDEVDLQVICIIFYEDSLQCILAGEHGKQVKSNRT